VWWRIKEVCGSGEVAKLRGEVKKLVVENKGKRK